MAPGGRKSDSLEQHGDALAHADAQRHQRVARSLLVQPAHRGGGQARAAHAERVADGDRAAVGIDVRRVVGQAGVFALVQMVILLLWSRAGMLVNAFVPIEDGSLASLLEFLALGSLFGSVFAVATFAIAAFSLPMIADRDVDMVTAGISSVNAVLRNKGTALVWAALIAVLTAVGLATAFLGLAIVMPWLAYAAWHGYREALDASAWPSLEAEGAEPGSTRSSA